MNKKSDFFIALKWITDMLNHLDIPYQIVGGLAAMCYGSTRPLHDIDFYVPGKDISKLEEELAEYIKFGPEQHQDENWNLVFMKLSYNGPVVSG
jgi:predicted nucleotidyltransferase